VTPAGLTNSMGLSVFALQGVVVLHMDALPCLDMGLLSLLVIGHESIDGLLILAIEELADLFDISNNCVESKVVSNPKQTYQRVVERNVRAAALDLEKSIRQTIRSSFNSPALGAILSSQSIAVSCYRLRLISRARRLTCKPG
jgi:hypothetical protein